MQTESLIQVIENAFPKADKFIECLNNQPNNYWTSALVSQGELKQKSRTADVFGITTYSSYSNELKVWDNEIELMLKTLLSEYKKSFPFLGADKIEKRQVVRYQRGGKYTIHVDAASDTPYRELSAVLYLNEDYVGGDIYFPQQNVKVKPKKGSCVLFPSNFLYPHASLPIISGVKYCVPCWYF